MRKELRGPLYLNRFRAYDARVGQYLQPEPMMGMRAMPWPNAYSYALQSPVLFVDPLGLEPQSPRPDGSQSPGTGGDGSPEPDDSPTPEFGEGDRCLNPQPFNPCLAGCASWQQRVDIAREAGYNDTEAVVGLERCHERCLQAMDDVPRPPTGAPGLLYVLKNALRALFD